MKQAWQRLITREETTDKFHALSTVLMIMLFIAFWGAGFYVLMNTFS